MTPDDASAAPAALAVPAPAGVSAGIADADVGDAAAPDEAEEDEPERGPLRRCLVTRERGERARMLRFVVAPDGRVVPDLAARLPGRGMWLSARADVLETARARGAFPRAARRPVTVPADLSALVQGGLAGRVADLLGLARRAGEAVAGFTKAREWVVARRVALVLQAADGSADERARLLSGAGDVPAFLPLDAARLGAVFGREQAVHVAVARGGLAGRLLLECGRLAGVTEAVPAGTSGRAQGRGQGRAPRGAGETAQGGARAPAAAPGSGAGTAAGRPGARDGGPRHGRPGDAARSGTPDADGTRAAGVPAVPQGGRTGT